MTLSHHDLWSLWEECSPSFEQESFLNSIKPCKPTLFYKRENLQVSIHLDLVNLLKWPIFSTPMHSISKAWAHLSKREKHSLHGQKKLNGRTDSHFTDHFMDLEDQGPQWRIPFIKGCLLVKHRHHQMILLSLHNLYTIHLFCLICGTSNKTLLEGLTNVA